MVVCCKYAAKGRLPCTRDCRPNSEYCVLHMPLKGDRVKCELCSQMIPKYSTRHARVCSGAKRVQMSYYHTDYNMSEFNMSANVCPTTSGEVNAEELATKIAILYNKYAESMLDREIDPAYRSDDILHSNCAVGKTPAISCHKHRAQEEGMVRVMRRFNMIRTRNCTHNRLPDDISPKKDHLRIFVDFGAGKGNLSKAVCLSVDEGVEAPKNNNSLFVCIERLGYKHKAERNCIMKHRSMRAQIDLRHLNLKKLMQHAEQRLEFGALPSPADERNAVEGSTSIGTGRTAQVPFLATTDGSRESCDNPGCHSDRRQLEVVAMGKHLCGNATDLALAALHKSMTCTMSPTSLVAAGLETASSSVVDYGELTKEIAPGGSDDCSATECDESTSIRGICIALCCHSNCVWESTVARRWLETEANITREEFSHLRKWSGMFNLQGQTGPLRPQCASTEESKKDSESTSFDRGRDYEFRAKLGYMCKRLIDFGRVDYVQRELGLNCRLLRYVDGNVTPENVALVAWSI